MSYETATRRVRITEESAFARLHLARVVREIEFLFGADSNEFMEAVRALRIVEQISERMVLRK